MKFSLGLTLLLAGLALFGATREELQEFFPVAKALREGNVAGNMPALESLAKRNVFASQALYLIHSRGYGGQSIDYRKAVEYFDLSFRRSEPFWTAEFREVWEARRLPPTPKTQSITINVWGGSYQQPRVLRRNFLLQGKYPLVKCYLEEMANIGGIGARVLFSACSGVVDRNLEIDKELHSKAIELGCAAAKYSSSSGIGSGIGPEQFKLLRSAADDGYVPAMIRAAEILTNFQRKEGPPLDLKAARLYLNRAAEKCAGYAPVGCKHAEGDLNTAKKLLAEIPDPDLSTLQLLESGKTSKSQVYSELLVYILAARDDHPSCGYFRALLEPDPRKALAMKKEAAMNGSAEAVRHLLATYNIDSDDYWMILYLAGKLGFQSEKKLSYYEQAFAVLQSKGYRLPGNGYKEGLAQLAEVHPPARQLYDSEFGREEKKEERLTFRVSHPETLAAEWFELQGRKGVKLSVKPSDQQRYVDFTRTPLPDEKPGSLSIRGNVSGLNNYVVWCDLILPDGKKKRIGVNEFYSGPLPLRMRLNVAPGDRTFELLIQGL